MSWSTYYSSFPSKVAKNSQQRIALQVDPKSFNESTTTLSVLNQCVELAKAGFLHLYFRCDELTTTENIISALKKVEGMLDLETNNITLEKNNGVKLSKHFFTTFEITRSMSSSEVLDVLGQSNLRNTELLLLFRYSGDKWSFIKEVEALAKHNGEKYKINLGITGLTDQFELDWVLSKIPSGCIQAVHASDVRFPNLRLRLIELIHSYGYNTIIDVDKGILDEYLQSEKNVLREYARSYEVYEETFLAKCILQLGMVMTVPMLEADSKVSLVEWIESRFSRLIHPFVHRKLFVSQVKVVSLQISNEDIEAISAGSEAIERTVDRKWSTFTQAPEHRQLIYNG